MLNSLFVTRGKDVGKSFTVAGEKVTIGRDRANTIRVNDDEVSRHHCSVVIEPEGVFLTDEKSSNGTYLNGELITKAKIKRGDEIRLGKTQLVFDSLLQIKIDGQSAAPQTASPTRVRNRALEHAEYADAVGVETSSFCLKLDKDNDSTYERLANVEGQQEADKQFVQLKSDLRFVYRASLTTSRSLDTGKMFNELIQLIFDWVEADRGCVLLKDGAKEEFSVRYMHERNDSWHGGKNDQTKLNRIKEFRIDQSVIDHVKEKRVGVLSPTAGPGGRARFDHQDSQLIIGEVLCVPIEGRNGDLLGMLYTDRLVEKPFEIESRFNLDHLRLMLAMAYQAADAIENETYYNKLIERERLSAIGEVTSLMSHRINNILQGLSGGSHLVQAGLDTTDLNLCRTGWEITQKNQDQISQLVRDLLVLSNPFDPHKSICGVGELVGATIAVMETELSTGGVECEVLAGPNDSCVVFLDPNYFKTALTNLIRLAVRASLDRSESGKSKCIRIRLVGMSGEIEVQIDYEGLPIDGCSKVAVGVAYMDVKPETGTSETITPDNGAPDDGASDDGASDDGASDDGASDNGASDNGASDNGASDNGASGTSSSFDGGIELAVAEKIAKGHNGALGFSQTAHCSRIVFRLPLHDAQSEVL